jgi:hypothetical protein
MAHAWDGAMSALDRQYGPAVAGHLATG